MPNGNVVDETTGSITIMHWTSIYLTLLLSLHAIRFPSSRQALICHVVADETVSRANHNKSSRRRQHQSKNDRHGNEDFSDLTDISTLFVTRRPRDVFEGIRAAVVNIGRGSLYGITGLLASPLTGGLSSGINGFVQGTISGIIVGLSMPILGFILSVYQLTRGIISTTESIKAFLDCKMFDEVTRTWQDYSLDDDIEQINAAIKDEESKSQRDSSARRKVKDTEFYELLGVQTNASSSEIRAAYRKKAREVHPDKVDKSMRESAEKTFREISAAYETLSDPQSRLRYDKSGIGSNEDSEFALDPYAFFGALFGSELVEQYVGELSIANAFDSLLRLSRRGDTELAAFESLEELKAAIGYNVQILKKRKRETEIAIHLHSRVADYVDGLLALDAFKESCYQEAVTIAKEASGTRFLLAIGPPLVAEANYFLGRGPVSNVKRKLLKFRRKASMYKTILYTVKESVLIMNAECPRDAKQQSEASVDCLSNTIPLILEMAWTINYVDIATALSGACNKLFYDVASSKEERLLRAQAVHVMGSQFHLVGLQKAGNFTAPHTVDEIKDRASAAFAESMKRAYA